MNWFTIASIIASLFLSISTEYIPPGPRYRCPEKQLSIFPCKCIKEADIGINVRCENTNLASLSIGLNNLARHGAPIEELVLHKCHIDKLFGNVFFKPIVRVLKIEETPITKIDQYTFYGINETLNEFHMTNSMLIEFPKEAFKILGNLSLLNIDGHKIEKLDKDIFAGSMATGKLERLHFVNGELQDLPIESFQPLRKLKTLDVHGNKLTALKRNQFKDLRDVEVLDISFNKLAKLDATHISDLTKMGWCNVSHNELAELSRGTFARNSVLKWLSMSHNKIKRLDTNSFRGMRFLRRLFMSDNAITDVGRGTFSSITRIGTIDLARNLLKKVDYQMFAQLNYVELVDVAENNITEVQKQAFKDLYLARINMSHNAISKIEADAFENCVNITLLDLSHNNLSDINKNAFDSNTYALEIQISYNHLTALNQIPMHNMTGLKILNVSHNALISIPKNTFPKLYELHTIDVSHNNISEIYNAVFQTLFSLRTINLSYNSLEVIKSPTFGTLPTLLELDLSNNKLKNMATGSVTKLASCRTLSVANNMLEKIFTLPISLNHLNFQNNWVMEIPDRNWPVMNALLTMDLSGNRLSDNLRGGTFAGLLTLQRLNLNNNGISRVPWESFATMTTLQYLNLENNNLTELKKGAFGKLPVVFELNLHNNHISNISAKAFDGLLQLLTLNLSSNALKYIPNEAFFGLVSMRSLDLSHNSLDRLDNKTQGVLDDCLSLQTINLSHNRISFVTRKTFPSNPYIPYRLKEIDLSYNAMPVLTYDITVGTKQLTHLNLSHNFINDIRRYVLGNLTSLKSLDLSHNELHDLMEEPFTFDLPKNLTHLYLQNNTIIQMPIDKVVNATNLEVLDLRHNDFESIDKKLVGMIVDGVKIDYDGNPLICDCSVRPLQHYLLTLTEPPAYYSDLRCAKPQFVEGQPFSELRDDYLTCDRRENRTAAFVGDDYEPLPDLRFRSISYTQGKLHAQWYVTTAARDIADFYVNIRDLKNNIKFEQTLAYDLRRVEIDDKDIPALNGDGPFQLCVMAKSSGGIINGWFPPQCPNLPADLNNVKNKYNDQYKKTFTILSTNKRIKVSKSSAPSGASLSVGFAVISLIVNFIKSRQLL